MLSRLPDNKKPWFPLASRNHPTISPELLIPRGKVSEAPGTSIGVKPPSVPRRKPWLVPASSKLPTIWPELLIPPAADPAPPPRRDPRELAGRIYRHALSREAAPGELAIATKMAAGGPEGLADLLWAVFSTPEFQYIR